MKKIFIFCLLLPVVFSAQSQSYFKETVKTIEPEFVYSLVPAGSSNTIMLAANALTTQQSVAEDYIAEFASDGSLLWNKSFLFKDDKGATGAIKTTDGGYAMVTFAGYFVKLKSDRSVQFIKKLTISGNQYVSIRGGLLQTPDNGYVFAGSYGQRSGDATNDVYLCKLDNAGMCQWCKKIMDDGSAYRLKAAKGGSFLVAGYTSVTDSEDDMVAIKTDSLGNVIFSHAAGGQYYDEANDVVETSDGGCILVGQKATADFVGSGYIAKFTNTGSLTWTKTIGLAGAEVLGASVVSDRNNTSTITIIAVSDSGANTGYQYLLNVSNNGRINKSATSVLGDGAVSFFSAGCRGSNKSLWLGVPARYNNSDVFILAKSDSVGANCTPATLPFSIAVGEGAGNGIDRPAVTLTAATRTAQYQSAGDGGTTVTNICSSAQSFIADAPKPAQKVSVRPASLSLSPNPATSFIRITGLQAGTDTWLTLLDAMGKTAATDKINGSVYNRDIASLPGGTYYIRVQTKSDTQVLRFVK